MNIPMQFPAVCRGSELVGSTGILLVLAITSAVAVRFYSLDNAALLPDECFSFRLSQYPYQEIVQRTALDVHPPLFYLLLKLWFDTWGASPLGLRAFGAFWSIAAVPLIYWTCLEAFHAGRSNQPRASQPAALLVAFLFALHLSEVSAGRFGRMYSLGVFLATLSAWLLLRASRARESAVWWWTAYGVTIAAFCYTHNYAFFTVFAQTAFFLGESVARWRTTSFREVRASLEGFSYAGILALILFAPWIPVLLAQMREVQDSFWIPPLKWSEVGRIFFSWGLGLEHPESWHLLAWPLAFFCLVAVTLWRGGLAGWFFLLQAMIPWALALGLSLISGRPILMERYLVFAHVFLLAFWGWVWLLLPGALERVMFTCIIGGMAVAGLVDAMARWPTGRPAIESAAAYLATNRQPGDLAVAPHPIALNCFRCYADHAGAGELDLRTLHSSFANDALMSHAYALAPNDVMGPEYMSRPAVRRIWIVTDGGPSAATVVPDMEKILVRSFGVHGESQYSLILFARKE
jgi:Dolichyl-phosphate-mannose-protein mannosyltransferase